MSSFLALNFIIRAILSMLLFYLVNNGVVKPGAARGVYINKHNIVLIMISFL